MPRAACNRFALHAMHVPCAHVIVSCVPTHACKQFACCRLPEAVEGMLDYSLPSDIVHVSVERGGAAGRPELDIEVRRRTPALAYAILAAAILCASTYDISMQLLVRCLPLGRKLAKCLSHEPSHLQRVCLSCAVRGAEIV
jgi:hypothetical protein